MLILGLLLAAAALVVFGFLLLGTRDLTPLQIDLGVFTVELTPLHLYLLGAATLVVLVLGLFFLTIGLRASRRRRREVKDLRAAVRDGGGDPAASGVQSDAGQSRSRDTGTSSRFEGEVDPTASSAEESRTSAPYGRDVPDGRQGTVAPPPQSSEQNIALPSDHAKTKPSTGNEGA